MKMVKTIVTGSSGYVASELIPLFEQKADLVGVDQVASEQTILQVPIESPALADYLQQFSDIEFKVINLAAARFDFGARPEDYYRLNVECHERFLATLDAFKVNHYIHISSVAALDGEFIDYNESLSCDDAYRSTKYLQDIMIQKWCGDRGIKLTTLYPSAVFSDDPRADTNIGKLQTISRYVPFIPKIEVAKSLTYLPAFCRFIVDSAEGNVAAGRYLAIEKPVLTVSRIIQAVSGSSVKVIHIPGLEIAMQTLAYLFYALGCFGKFDLKLTPNRVVKLFSDTSYNNIKKNDIDIDTYSRLNEEDLIDILKRLGQL